MEIRSDYWDKYLGVCEKHGIPSVPCPICLGEHDAHVEFVLDLADLDAIAYENSTIDEFLPEGFSCATHRVISK